MKEKKEGFLGASGEVVIGEFCCEVYALSQEYRELKNCGFDMGIGKAQKKTWKARLQSPSFWGERNSLVSEQGESEELDMEDQRLLGIENKLEARTAEQDSKPDQMQDRMNELFAALTTWLDQLAVGRNFQDDESAFNNGGRYNGGRFDGTSFRGGQSYNYLPRLVKLDFPRFNGEEDPTSRICMAEQFYTFHQTPEEDKVPLASFNLEGEAQLWFQLLKEEQEAVTWEVFKTSLHSRYGPTQFEDFFGTL